MANSKISALTSATTPLAGTETLPVVQSSTTNKVSVANLTAGRAVSGASYAVTGAVAPANGMYLYAANSLGLATNSALSAIVDSSQNWRIGHTYAPSTTTALSAQGVYNSSPPSTSSNVNIRASGGGAVSIWLSSYAYSYAWIQAIQDDGSNNLKQLALQPLGGGITIGGDATFSTGNLIQGTAAKGINFTANTPAAGMTSQLLNWYEEGTWTPIPTRSGGSLSATYTSSGIYTRIGRVVTLHGQINITGITSQTGAYIVVGGLPFASVSPFNNYQIGGVVTYNGACNGSIVTKMLLTGNELFAGTDKSSNFPPDGINWSTGQLAFTITYYTT